MADSFALAGFLDRAQTVSTLAGQLGSAVVNVSTQALPTHRRGGVALSDGDDVRLR